MMKVYHMPFKLENISTLENVMMILQKFSFINALKNILEIAKKKMYKHKSINNTKISLISVLITVSIMVIINYHWVLH